MITDCSITASTEIFSTRVVHQTGATRNRIPSRTHSPSMALLLLHRARSSGLPLIASLDLAWTVLLDELCQLLTTAKLSSERASLDGAEEEAR